MDIEHSYIEKGSGEPLILLHGNGESGDYFVHQLDELSAAFRVIAVDTRGHGQTPRGCEPFTVRQFAEDLAGFMDRLSIEKSHILGFSDGANIAMCYAIRYPHRVDRLILNGGNLDPSGIKPSVQIPIEIGYRIARSFAKKSEDARKNAELLGLMVNDPNLLPSDLFQITAKTLVIAGNRDMVKDKHTKLIADSIPNARLVIIKGNHFIANQNPNAFNRAVLDFLCEKADERNEV